MSHLSIARCKDIRIVANVIGAGRRHIDPGQTALRRRRASG
jgi:hypothetical protein